MARERNSERGIALGVSGGWQAENGDMDGGVDGVRAGAARRRPSDPDGRSDLPRSDESAPGKTGHWAVAGDPGPSAFADAMEWRADADDRDGMAAAAKLGEADEEEEEEEYVFKVVVVGDYGVGKTSLVRRLVDYGATATAEGPVDGPSLFSRLPAGDDGGARFEAELAVAPTVGTDFFSCVVPDVVPGVHVRLQFWDTAGLERYAAVHSATYRHASVVLCVFDVSERRSLASVVKQHLSNVAQYAPHLSLRHVVVAGNKVDVVGSAGAAAADVAQEDVQQMLHDANGEMCYAEVSAKRGTNVGLLLQLLCLVAVEGECPEVLRRRQQQHRHGAPPSASPTPRQAELEAREKANLQRATELLAAHSVHALAHSALPPRRAGPRPAVAATTTTAAAPVRGPAAAAAVAAPSDRVDVPQRPATSRSRGAPGTPPDMKAETTVFHDDAAPAPRAAATSHRDPNVAPAPTTGSGGPSDEDGSGRSDGSREDFSPVEGGAATQRELTDPPAPGTTVDGHAASTRADLVSMASLNAVLDAALHSAASANQAAKDTGATYDEEMERTRNRGRTATTEDAKATASKNLDLLLGGGKASRKAKPGPSTGASVFYKEREEPHGGGVDGDDSNDDERQRQGPDSAASECDSVDFQRQINDRFKHIEGDRHRNVSHYSASPKPGGAASKKASKPVDLRSASKSGSASNKKSKKCKC